VENPPAQATPSSGGSYLAIDAATVCTTARAHQCPASLHRRQAAKLELICFLLQTRRRSGVNGINAMPAPKIFGTALHGPIDNDNDVSDKHV